MSFLQNVPLKDWSNFRIGGPALYFQEVSTLNELKTAVRRARREHWPIFILGGGTNILWPDKGFAGVVIKPNFNFIKEIERNVIAVGAGVSMTRLLRETARRGLGGLEWAGGLPGTFGGALYGNAGAFGGEIKDLIEEVVSLDLANLALKKRAASECGFGYRNSVFKSSGQEVIIQATLRLTPADRNLIQAVIQERIEYRKRRHPLEYPNIGSIFKNIPLAGLRPELVKPHLSKIKFDPFPVIPAAYLLEQAGLKGVRIGGAAVSVKHANFIVNLGGARASDVLSLIQLMKEAVAHRFNIFLEEEVKIVN
jgi:UDP-N-acetylmuramate dehydrogenase